MDSRPSSFVTLLGLCVSGLLLVGMPGETHGSVTSSPQPYKSIWDKVDWTELLENKRLTEHYFNCLMDKGKCVPLMKNVKKLLPEALATGCARCTERQVEIASTVVHHLRKFEPEKFESLANKYDPEGTYRQKYQDYYYTTPH